MKKLLFSLLLCTIATVLSFSQLITTMNIYRTDGTILYIPLNTIDSIKYSVSVDVNCPRIISADVSQEEVEGGTNLSLHLVVESPYKVNWLTESLFGPNGNIHGGGGTCRFIETSEGIYEYTSTTFLSEWMPNGEYYYSGISVENEARYVSEKWTMPLKTMITTHTNSATIPEILNVELSQEEVDGGTNLKLKIIATSTAPVNWLTESLFGPNGNIHGGGGTCRFIETSEGIYEYTSTTFLSEWMPNGKYYYTNIYVENEAKLKSEKWESEVFTTIYTHKEDISAPTIKSVTLTKESVSGGTKLNLKIIASSNAPVNWLNISLYGPNGNIHGGGSGRNFVETSEGIYEYTESDFISSVEPSGKYYYSNLSVENASGLESEVWKEPLEITIKN